MGILAERHTPRETPRAKTPYRTGQDISLERSDYANGHLWAKAVSTVAFRNVMGRQPSLCEQQMLQGVAWAESNYGNGWKGQGAGSYNMGAIQAGKPPCDADEFLYTDTHPTASGDNVPYEICFRKYPSPLAGFEHLVKILYVNRPTVLAAAEACSIAGVSKAMYETTYYEGWGATPAERIGNHIKYLTRALTTVTKGTGDPMPASTGGTFGDGASAFGWALVLGGAGFMFYKAVS